MYNVPVYKPKSFVHDRSDSVLLVHHLENKEKQELKTYLYTKCPHFVEKYEFAFLLIKIQGIDITPT